MTENGNGTPENGEFSTEDPLFLFNLFRSDVVAAEVDWENERFLFYPVNAVPDPRA